jgi:hypothetical protein|tara:strand:- start:13163 stop:13387 length:225 start_codon:yes stop_codon:yes gene_type:complete
MGNVSVSIPDDLKQKINGLDEVNWSAVAREAFEEKVKQIELLRKIAKKSKLTERDAKQISDKISKSMTKKFRGL